MAPTPLTSVRTLAMRFGYTLVKHVSEKTDAGLTLSRRVDAAPGRVVIRRCGAPMS